LKSSFDWRFSFSAMVFKIIGSLRNIRSGNFSPHGQHRVNLKNLRQGRCLCGGWLLTHDRDHLLALRVHAHNLDMSVWSYAPTIEVFASGAEAAAHGISGIENPSPEAQRKIDGLVRQRATSK